MTLIFLASGLPVAGTLAPVDVSDKLIHAVAYAALGLLFSRSFLHAGAGRGVLLAAFASAAVYGLLDEWHQSFVPSRTACWADAAADTVGSAIGSALWWVSVLLTKTK